MPIVSSVTVRRISKRFDRQHSGNDVLKHLQEARTRQATPLVAHHDIYKKHVHVKPHHSLHITTYTRNTYTSSHTTRCTSRHIQETRTRHATPLVAHHDIYKKHVHVKPHHSLHITTYTRNTYTSSHTTRCTSRHIHHFNTDYIQPPISTVHQNDQLFNGAAL